MTHFVPPGEELGYAFEKTALKKKGSNEKIKVLIKRGG